MVMQRWNIAISGFGAIGKTIAGLLEDRKAHYAQRYGADVRLTAVCGSRAGLYAPDGLQGPWGSDRGSLQPGLTGTDFIEQTHADVLIDAGPTDYETGGAAYGYLRSALSHGMHAIAVSKGALIFDLAGLRALAVANGVALKFSGATAAALPTLDLIEYNLAGCRVLKIEGIFTATTNYVLSRMMDGFEFDHALSEAQQRGMAEPDPRFDIEGWDTACKIALIANASLGASIRLNDIERQGIDHLTQRDMQTWKAAGMVPKLVGEIIPGERELRAAVVLRGYPHDHPFARVGASMKAISIHSDAMGEVTALCRTSPLATAAAALKDFEHILMKR
jgi:homoserine dehydrogenase